MNGKKKKIKNKIEKQNKYIYANKNIVKTNSVR